MGNWNISIHGVGVHHNEGHAADANRMAADFVQRLVDAGHSVTAATITYGGEESVLEGVRYLQARNEAEKRIVADREQRERERAEAAQAKADAEAAALQESKIERPVGQAPGTGKGAKKTQTPEG